MSDDQRAQPPQGDPGVAGSDEVEDDERSDPSSPRITLDWRPRSKRSTYAAVGQLVTLIFMLAALVAIFIFKDRCGEVISDVVFIGAPDAGPVAPPSPDAEDETRD